MLARRLLMVAGGSGAFTLPEDDVALGWYNVKSYGAVGNGSHDDTAAITAAITAAPERSTVYFPPGVYKITSALAISKGLLLRGSGYPLGQYNDHSGGTVIWQATVNTNGITCSQSPNVDVTNTTWIEGLRITAQGDGTPSSGVGVYGLTDVNLSRCMVDNFYTNVQLDDHSWGSSFLDVNLSTPVYANLLLGASPGGATTTNHLQARSLICAGGQYGIVATNSQLLDFEGCLFEAATVAGVVLDGAASGNLAEYAATFSGCWFESPAARQLSLGPNYAIGGVTVTGSLFATLASGGYGIRQDHGGPLTVTGGRFNHTSEADAIYGGAGAGVLVAVNVDLNGGSVSWAGTSYSHLP